MLLKHTHTYAHRHTDTQAHKIKQDSKYWCLVSENNRGQKAPRAFYCNF